VLEQVDRGGASFAVGHRWIRLRLVPSMIHRL
jgi:hypothetical protein